MVSTSLFAENDYVHDDDGVFMAFNISTSSKVCTDIVAINDNVSEDIETATMYVTMEYGTYVHEANAEIFIKDDYGKVWLLP